MLHAVFLFVATGQLMLFDATCHIVVCMGADYKTVLRLSIHRLCIDVVVLLLILHQPTLVLELLEVLSCLLIHLWVVLRSAYGKVDFGFDDVIQTFLVVASFSASLF